MNVANRRHMILFRHGVAAQVLAARVEDLDKLPPLERRILLDTLTGQSQPEIARALHLSQPSISYRTHRSLERLNFLASYPHLGPSDVRGALRASGYVPSGVDFEEFVSFMAVFLKTTCQSRAAQRAGHTQGWFRHHVKKFQAALQEHLSEDNDTVLQALVMVEEHGHILAIENRHLATKTPGSSARELLDAAEQCSTLVPPPARPKKGLKISDAHLEVVIGILRENGPQLRSAVLEILTEEGIDATRALWTAITKGKVISRQGRGRGYPPPRVLHLLKPAATSSKESFHLDWHQAIHDYCKVYDSFLTYDVMGHIGIVQGYRAHQDNAHIVADLLKAEGFVEKLLGRWSRSTPHRALLPPEGREKICTRILETIATGGVVPRREIEAHVTASPSQVTGALRQLVAENKIMKMGHGSSTVYLSIRSV